MKRLLLLLSLWSFAGAQEVQLEREVFNIAGELRCPVCRSESAADSNAETSIEFRDIIRERLQDGQSEAQILTYFQRTYGDWILLDPPRRGLYLWVWGLPVAAGVLGLGLLGYFLTRWRKNATAPVEASPEDLERVRRELGSS
ncbi:MAG: Cytochrome c heme lyase subunit CcmL [uncultured Truepera sp.]|uniref:Cytochrome c-type biogenesis protein n=1 Tax=uncultured Truepera sp. TaxID=543023 RepID=A0A6J4VXM6_9DEIN|nr:MAG: Cytochrome c heme lyase subunit CcmL [uncultured Truepera sp.]